MLPQRFLIGGGSGFIGSALTRQLQSQGHHVTWISRHAESSSGPPRITWEDVRHKPLPAFDCVVNFAGKHILDVRRRWTEEYKQEVLDSRVNTTRWLVDAINKAEAPPHTFLSTAGKCFYQASADGNAAEQDENSPLGDDFPATLVGKWESAADHLDRERVKRHLRVRIGVVLGDVCRDRMAWLRIGTSRGFLPVIRLPFCLGLGGYLGSGQQLFPWIHIDDMTGILDFLIHNEECDGRYNAVAPNVVSNKEFTDEFAARLRRPIAWHIPDWLIRRILHEDRASILLHGANIKPTRTVAAGYQFKYPTIDKALDDLVKITF